MAPISEPRLPADRDTPKSRRTRTRILDAATGLFAEIGYHAATNARISDAADLTRGAMLYHFPTREALVEAAASHIQDKRKALLTEAAARKDLGDDAADRAIDIYWDLLQTPAFQAFLELEAVARTDESIAALIAPAQAQFDRGGTGDDALALVSAGGSPRIQASRDLARFALEGLGRARLTYDDAARTRRLLAVVKRATHMLNRKGDVADIWPE